MIVVDASVMLKWVVPEVGSAAATALSGEVLSAPSFWIAEVGNALWRKVRLGELTSADAALLFRQLRSADIHTSPIESDAAQALSLAIDLDHPIYDCLYLSLAIRQSTYVVTADNRFASAVRRHGTWASHLRTLTER